MFTKKVFFFSCSILLLSAAVLTPVAPMDAAAPVLQGNTEQTANTPKTTALLQYTADGHVLGFASDKVYLAGLDHALTVEFVGGQRTAPVGEAASGTGSVKTGSAQALGHVTYPNVWPGVDVIYTPVQGGLAESTYVVQPGAKPQDIRLTYNTPVQLMNDGTLRFVFETGYLTESEPVAWQEIDGKHRPVNVHFMLDNGEVGFAIGAYNPNHPLTIDPTYVWHTFWGSAGFDEGSAITYDSNGNIYIAGEGNETWDGPGSIAPLNAFAGSNSHNNIVIVKLNSAGVYQWHTFYGAANNYDDGFAITSDNAGNVYVVGESHATWDGPNSVAPLNAHSDGNTFRDIVVIKLNSAGNYQWHAFYGSVDDDFGFAVTSDSSNNIYIAGSSYAPWDGPGSTAPLNSYTDKADIVVLKLNSTGAYQWHTFYGSANDDQIYGITSDNNGNLYITGYSNGSWNGPSSTAPINNYVGWDDIVVVKLDKNGTYKWHTFLGANNRNYGYAITSDNNDNLYIAGRSDASWNGPGSVAPLNAYSGDYDIAVIKLNSAGIYQWHTFYGSSGSDLASGISSDSMGNAYITGSSNSTWNGPSAVSPLNDYKGNYDIVAFALNSSGLYQWHTFGGSLSDDYGNAIINFNGSLYVTGSSQTTWDGPSPSFTQPLNTYTGGTDIVVIKGVNNALLPNVVINQATSQLDPVNASPINFTATFSKPIDISSFTSGDVTLGGTAGATTAIITQVAPNDDTTFNIAVSGTTGSGTVTASIDAGKVTDPAGNPNTASTSLDNTVAYETTPMNRAFVGTHNPDGIIEIDTTNNTIIQTGLTWPIEPGVSAITPDGNRVFIAGLGGDGSVNAIDTSTSTISNTFSGMGIDQRGITISSDGNRLYVADNFYMKVMVIDLQTNTVVTDISLDAHPEQIALSPDNSKLYVAANYLGTIFVIDTNTNSVVDSAPVGGNPAGILASSDGQHIFVADSGANAILVLNASNLSQITTMPATASSFFLLSNFGGSKLYCLNHANSISVFDTTTLTELTTIALASSPREATITEDGSKIYVAATNEIVIVDTTTDAIISTIPVSNASAYSIAIKRPTGESAMHSISGNTGVAGATLSYTDGIDKTAVADANGDYSFTISNRWSGTVTPSKIGYIFTPASKSYVNLVADQTVQNYTAFLLPRYLWHTFLGSSNRDEGHAITRDASGNIYLTGLSEATWNGPGDIPPLNAHTEGVNYDIVVVKLNSAGVYQWHTFYGSSNKDAYHYGITSDRNGNIYVTSSSFATWNGPGNIAPLNPYSGNNDIVVLKLNSSGAYQWHTFYGSSDTDDGRAITSDENGNVYITGTSGASWNGPGAVPPLNAHTGSSEIVVLKLNSAGVYQWHTFYGSSNIDYGHAITRDGDGNIYIAGNSYATWNGPGAAAPLNAYTANGDIVVLKLDSAGAYQWHTFYGSSDDNADLGNAITSDGSGNIYIAGTSNNAPWNGPGSAAPLNSPGGIVVIKLNSAGAYQWHTFYGSSVYDDGDTITSDGNGNLYLAGGSWATWNGPGAAAPLNAYVGLVDIVIVKLNSAGVYQWHTFYGSPAIDEGYAITGDKNGNIYMAGWSGFRNATWDGPGAVAPLNAYADGGDMVVIKMSEDTIPPNVTIKQAASQPDPTTRSPINFSVTFSEVIDQNSFSDDDLTISGNAGATTAHITGEIAPYDGTTFNVAVSGMTTSGTVSLSLDAGKVADLAGNPNTASTSTDNTVNYIHEQDNLCTNVPALAFTQDPSGKLISDPVFDHLSASDDVDVFKFEASPSFMLFATLILPANSNIDDFDFRLYQGCDDTDPYWNDGKRPALHIGVGGISVNSGQNHTLVISRNIPNDLSDGSTFYLVVQKSTEGDYNPGNYQLKVTLQPPNVGLFDPNDVDGDGLWNDWEINGYTAEDGSFVDLPAMGADPGHKDIFVEIDPMIAADHSHQPKPDAMAKIVEAFNNAPVSNPDGKNGIHLHIDYGPESEMNPVTHQKWGALSGSNSLPEQENLGYGYTDAKGDYQYVWSAFDLIKKANFAKARATIFHYAIFAHHLSTELGDTSGIARDSGPSDFIVSLGGWDNNIGTVNEQAGTFMHELGHNLGLHHGGYDDILYKPNFLSVMNYLFQTRGLLINGQDGNFDYSRFKLPILVEDMLSELTGLGGDPGTNHYGTLYHCINWRDIYFINNPIDWNCNNINSEPNVQQDINDDGNMGSLIGFDDWFNLQYAGGSIGALGALPEIPDQTTVSREITQAEDSLLPSPYKVSIASSGNQTKAPGASTQVTFNLTNKGDNDDTYTITADSGLEWANLDDVPSTIHLAAGAAPVTIQIPVQIPASATSGQVEKISFTAISQANPNIEDQAIAMVTAIDGTAPDVTSIVRANTDSTSAASVDFTVTFSEPVTGVDVSDFSLTTSGISGAALTGVSGSGATRTVTVNTGSSNGTIRLDVPVSATITDLAGNSLTGLPYITGQVYTVNKTKTLVLTSIGGQDGWMLESAETSNKANTLNATSTIFNLGDNAARKQYRGILSFKTGVLIPDNAVITKVVLKVRKQGIVGGGNPVTIFNGFMADIKKGFFGSTSALQTSDFQALANKTYGPFKPTLVSGWYSINLTNGSAYINKLFTNGGLTQIRLRFKLDDNNDAVANYLKLYSGNAPAASRPKLVIKYYVP